MNDSKDLSTFKNGKLKETMRSKCKTKIFSFAAQKIYSESSAKSRHAYVVKYILHTCEETALTGIHI